jgi:hypothetical protein
VKRLILSHGSKYGEKYVKKAAFKSSTFIITMMKIRFAFSWTLLAIPWKSLLEGKWFLAHSSVCVVNLATKH